MLRQHKARTGSASSRRALLDQGPQVARSAAQLSLNGRLTSAELTIALVALRSSDLVDARDPLVAVMDRLGETLAGRSLARA